MYLSAADLACFCRAFVNATFAKCTPSNKPAVEAELKQVIYDAFQSNRLNSIDWANYKLQA